MEIQICMLQANLVENTGNGPTNTRIEPLGRIDMDTTTGIFAPGMYNGIMPGKAFADRYKGRCLIALQMGADPTCVSITRFAARNGSPVTIVGAFAARSEMLP